MSADHWLSDYQPSDPTHDAAVRATGEVRPAYRAFVARMSALDAKERRDIAIQAGQSLLETGIAFDVYADPEDRTAAWRQDMAPLLIDAAEWRQIEAGIVQRAHTVDALLSDLYGPQDVLRRGWLPAGAVFGNPSFLQQACGHQTERRLSVYACDIARQVDGRWCVLSDNAGLANGHGWVLAARIALSGAFGDIFTNCGVERLAGYFDRFGEMLRHQGEAVILAPGPDSPDYFSHAYLARYLGIPLVQTSDLSERHGEVFLKTLGGLEPIASLLRKTRAATLDGLSIAGADELGSPGLLQAVKANRVRLLNSAGSGLADNRLLAFLNPEFGHSTTGSEAFFAEAPALWLGAAKNIERFVGEPGWQAEPISLARNIADTHNRDPLGDMIDAEEKRRFLHREGYAWIARQTTQLPTAPAWDGTQIRHAHWAVRCFCFLDNDGNYRVMPGGLVHQTEHAQTFGMPAPSAIKDLWVGLPPGERTKPSILGERYAGLHLNRTGRRLLSRNAESLFWLGRYVERAEMGMRIVRTVLHRLNEDEIAGGQLDDLAAIASLLTGPCKIEFQRNHDSIAAALIAVLFDPDLDYGLHQSLEGIQRNAAMARGELSQDGASVLQWQAGDLRWRPAKGRRNLSQALAMLSAGIQRLLAFSGSQNENMTRDFAYTFLAMGRRSERAQQLAAMVQTLIVPDTDPAAPYRLAAMLEIADSSMTYRSRYGAAPLAAPVVDLLVLDENNPRSIAFQIERLEQSLDILPKTGPYRSDEHRLILALVTQLRLLDADETVVQDQDGNMPLNAVLASASADIRTATERLSLRHFAKADVPQTSFAMRRGPV